jgi:hypothetical protein
MHFPHSFCLLYELGSIELGYDLYVPVIVNTHEILKVVTLICKNDLIIDWILLLLHMMSVNPLSF